MANLIPANPIGRLFSQTNTVSGGASSTAVFTLSGTGFGSLTLTPKIMTEMNSIHIRATGLISKGAGNHTINLLLNGVTLVTTGSVNSGAGLNQEWIMDVILTIRTKGAGGTIMGQGYVTYGTGTAQFGMVLTAPVAINTTINQVISVQGQWASSNAANLTSMTNMEIIGIF